ncbi:caspase-2-like isoform X2 [Tachypleus tridentatus]|uniref:caspase-2-like isoform X2 n=1 Tax=Tachypleus tridentatus TaxID=6853 RepID=UPI003FD2C5FA
MDPDHRKILQSNFVKLSELISLDEIVPLLLEERVFTEHMMEDILAENTDTDRKHKLMLDLPRRGPNAFKTFLDILLKTGNYDAAMILDPDIEIPNSDIISSEHVSLLTSSFRHVSIMPVNEGTAQHFVKPATEWKEGPDCYKMSSQPRGYCLIINNVLFQNILSERYGSYEDARKLDIVFHEFGYEVTFLSDRTAQEILGLVKEFSEKQEHNQVDSCVVIILSHGNYNTIYGSDVEKVQLDTILNFFNNDNCPQLHGKPKMFFIQACQGDNHDRGVSGCYEADSKPFIQHRTRTAPQPIVPAFSLQAWSDMLISHSTLPV